MSNEVNPHTTGDGPIANTGPVIEIAGQEYTLRRLGIKDTFAVARIIAIGQMSSKQSVTTHFDDPEMLTAILLAGVMGAEKVVMDLLASIVGVTTKDLEDPEKFPMGSELTIIEALVQHQDIKAFLARVGSLAKKLPEMQTRSRAAST